MRKLIAFFLAVLFVFGSFGSIFAGTVTEHEKPMKTDITEPTRAVYSGTCGADLTWTLDTETGLLEITGTGDMTNWSSSSSVPWYSYRTSVKTVEIGNSVTSIGDYAFRSCSSLTTVTIPDSVTSIGDFAFYNCDSLTSVTIGNGVTSIGKYAFCGCNSLTTVTIPDSVTSIGRYAFSYCSSLASVTIPDSVTSIGSYAFSRCTSLTTVTIPDSVTSIGEYAFYSCSSLTTVTIPDSVTSIGIYAFSGCSLLTSVTIPDSVTSIGDGAFSECNLLNSVTIPDSVTSIGDSAFYGCSSLTSVTIPDSVTSIGEGAFWNCSSLTSVTIPGSVTSIGSYVFSGCSKLTTVTIGNSVTSIGDHAFYGCISLTTVTIPDGVTSIGNYAFCNCSSLTSITVDVNNQQYTSIDGVLFNKAATVLIQYPGGKTGDYVIPGSVTSIGGSAFSRCSSLTSVTIPGSVTSIGSYAFYYCSSLTSAVFLGAPPSSFDSYVFYLCASDFCIYYTPAHASEWAPNGETTWNGYPIAPLSNSGKCLVKFLMNDGSGAIYKTQLVNDGERVDKPKDPTRAGYVFKGWYANPNCSGVKWFDSTNNDLGKPVTANLNLYAKWEEREFDFEIDWFSFTNSDVFFFEGDTTPKEKQFISGEYYYALMKAFGIATPVLWAGINLEWGGSCFGMSAVSALIYANRLDTNFFQDGCYLTRLLNKPIENPALLNLIEYYQLIQLSPITLFSKIHSNIETTNCKRLIDSLKSSRYPVVFGIEVYERKTSGNGYEKTMGHAMLAFGYTEIDDSYIVNVADPNEWKIIHLEIEKDTYRNLGFDRNSYSNGDKLYSIIEESLTVESLSYDYQNIQDYLTGKGYTSGSLARDIEDEVYTTLTTNFNSFRIDGPNGEYAVIEYGEKTEGDLDIGSGQCMNDIGSELQLEFTVPVLGAGESYTVLPAECYSVVTEDPLEEYHASLICSGENGFWADSTAGSGAEFVFGSDGSVSTTCTESCAQSATVCRNDMTTDWSCVTVDSAETATLTAVPTSDSAAIIADPDAEYDITVSSFHNDAVFEGIVGGSAGVTVTEDEHKNAVITYNSNSAVAASGVFGCSLIFCTMGGSEIETQTGIVPGTTAAAPYDPTRTGMLFGGWYTTYGCEEGTEWSFDTPLTEDTYIYAKWEEDEDYIHSVTFHIEDGFDTIYYVYNGEALTDYELPEIPEIEGYTASWPEIDLSCIMEDIVIEPIYAPEPTLTPGDVDGDGLVTMADVTLLSMYLNGEDPQITEPGMANADANEDGTVDIRDIAAIYAIIAAS